MLTQGRRESILEAALDLFAAKGFDATSTKEIATAAGVAEGLIFHHFKNKANLLASIFETRHSYLGELKGLFHGARDVPPERLLTRLASEGLARLRQERRLSVVLFTVAQTDPAVQGRLREAISEGTGSLAAYLAQRRDAGELRRDVDLEAAAFAFLSPLFAFFLVHRDLTDADWEQRTATFVRAHVATWLDGAAAR